MQTGSGRTDAAKRIVAEWRAVCQHLAQALGQLALALATLEGLSYRVVTTVGKTFIKAPDTQALI